MAWIISVVLLGGGKQLGMRKISFTGMLWKYCVLSVPDLVYSFMPATVIGPNDAVERAIRRAVIEVHTLKDAAQPLIHACKISAESEVDLSDIKFSAKKGDTLAIVFAKPDKRQELLDSVGKDNNSRKGVATSSTLQGSAGASVDVGEREVLKDSDEFILGDSSVPKSVGAAELEPISDDTWLAVSLRDPTFKFAVSESDLS